MERLHKMVNGEKVYLTDEEEAAIRAEWAENDLKHQQTSYIQKRKMEYPHITKQLEILCEQGLPALQKIINDIKAKYPKPESPDSKGSQ